MKKKYIIVVAAIILIIACLISVYAASLFLNRQNDNAMENNNISSSSNATNNNEASGGNQMEPSISKINLTIRDQVFTATLEDNETARAFLELLPLDIIMEDLNSNEKFYYLNDSLPSKPVDVNAIHAGDLMLYGNDCLVLFYDDFKTSYTYTRIGKVDNPDHLKQIVSEGNVSIYLSRE